jgi:iron complex outermembrane recepter protein
MKLLIISAIVLSFTNAFAQIKDTLNVEEVKVKAYFSEQPIGNLPVSVSSIDFEALQSHAPFSLVPALNTVPGVGLEERSPASYRLSIRGSLLRSPFGVRNVKVYLDDFILTDASGNTYFNSLDAGSVSGIEIIKGPEGSIYGANTGGVMLLKPFQTGDSVLIRATLGAASYDTYLQRFSFQHKQGKFQLGMQQAILKSGGYRDHSKSGRKYLHLTPQFNYSSRSNLKALLLFSDLAYETPGGLTQEQFNQNPQGARAIAVSQQAGIFNKTILTGLSHEYKFSNNMRHVISFTGSSTDFKNPFVTNYELRDERSMGLRTYAEWRANTSFPFSLQAGFEAQQTCLRLKNFVNEAGERGQPQKETNLQANLSMGFLHMEASPINRLNVETGLSVNRFNYQYSPVFPMETSENKRTFKDQLMPRLAASYQLLKGLVLRGSVSRGFSTPTLEEVNPSGTNINNLLQAENGWNKELGLRSIWAGGKLYWDVVYFNYKLKKSIVRGVNADETDYYINAGSTDQNGLESEIVFKLIPLRNSGFVRGIQLKNSSTFYQFKFANYVNGRTDYSGNKLTGVPNKTIISSVLVDLPFKSSVFVQHNYTSTLPLNDANSVWAKKYHLMNAKVTWKGTISGFPLHVFAGADNILDEKYSLGNDLNALGGRFFNPAASRNYYFGITLEY